MLFHSAPRFVQPILRGQLLSPPKMEPVGFNDYVLQKQMPNSTENETVVASKLKAARESVEKYTQKALVVRTYNGFLDVPPGNYSYQGAYSAVFTSLLSGFFGEGSSGTEIKFPNRPLRCVIGAWVTDASGTETLIPNTSYWVTRSKSPGRMCQSIGSVWPDTLGRYFETFRVQWASGMIAPFTATQGVADLTCPYHGKLVGDLVNIQNREGALPAPLKELTDYYVVSTSPTTFQLSATLAGSPIVITDIGSGNQFLDVLDEKYRRCILALAVADRYGATSGKAQKLRADMEVSDSPKQILRTILSDERKVSIYAS